MAVQAEPDNVNGHSVLEPVRLPHRIEPVLEDSRLIAGVPEILSIIGGLLPERAVGSEVMPLIRDAVRGWIQSQVRLGMAVPSPSDLEALATAVYDQRYGLGPLASYLRDPEVENVDVNGFDRVWVTYSTGERIAVA